MKPSGQKIYLSVDTCQSYTDGTKLNRKLTHDNPTEVGVGELVVVTKGY